MRQFLLNYVKTNGLIYDLYYYIGSFLLRLLGKVIKTDEKCILFVSFGGKKFDDSPKAIYDEMIKQQKFKDLKYYWAFVDPEKFDIQKGKKIKIDTLKYFCIAQKSKIWVTNSAIERGLNFKKKDTFYINTWHGTPLKKIGKDENSISKKNGLGSKNISTQNITLAQSKYDAKIFEHIFNTDYSNIMICDLPRNDELHNVTSEKRAQIRKKLGIDENKKVILYAPTYREYKRDENNNCYIKPPINLEIWEQTLGSDYRVFFRAHYEVAKILGLKESKFIKDTSNYKNLNELMIASDMLISDYSSIFFDYSILEKPMFCFAYDLEEYSIERGLYLDLKEELPCRINKNEMELLDDILDNNNEERIEKTKQFKQKYAPHAGDATRKIVKMIERNLYQ